MTTLKSARRDLLITYARNARFTGNTNSPNGGMSHPYSSGTMITVVVRNTMNHATMKYTNCVRL